jgi:hypothetical protein
VMPHWPRRVSDIDFAFDGPTADDVQLFFVFYFVAT